MMFSVNNVFACLVLALAPLQVGASSSSSPPQSSSGKEWVSLSERVEFLPTAADDENESNFLRRAQERVLSKYSSQSFAEGATETAYNEYATAWRLLGVYVDCSATAVEQRRERRHRVLEDAEENEDEDENEEGQDDEDGNQEEDQYFVTTCPRYLLWEAYVDMDYAGGGMGEYSLFNPATNEFDLTSCSGKRCAKLDCHLPSTHFSRLGYFKEYGVYDWLEQLITYQGACSWSQEQYNLLSSTYALWPQECTLSSAGTVYYDVKPNPSGEFAIGLYTDSLCTIDYEGGMTVEAVLQASNEDYNNGGDDDDGSGSQAVFATDEWFQEWNEALSAFKTCQPCKTLDVTSSSNGRRRRRRRRLDDGSQCEADINQCAMFAENTDIQPASFRDVRLATQQGSIVKTYGLAGVAPSGFKTWWREWGLFTLSLSVFVIGLVAFCCLVKVKKRPSLNEPLLQSGSNTSSRKSSKSKSSRK